MRSFKEYDETNDTSTKTIQDMVATFSFNESSDTSFTCAEGIYVDEEVGACNDESEDEPIAVNEINVGGGGILSVIMMATMHVWVLVAMIIFEVPLTGLCNVIAFGYLFMTILFYGGVIIGYYLDKPMSPMILNTILPRVYSFSMVILLVIALFMRLPAKTKDKMSLDENTTNEVNPAKITNQNTINATQTTGTIPRKFTVEKILDGKYDRFGKKWKVKWKDNEKPTWERKKNFFTKEGGYTQFVKFEKNAHPDWNMDGNSINASETTAEIEEDIDSKVPYRAEQDPSNQSNAQSPSAKKVHDPVMIK